MVLTNHTVNRYLFKPCDVPWTDGIIALEAGEQNYLYLDAVCNALDHRHRLRNRDPIPPN